MNPIVMSMLVDAKLDDVFKEAEKQRTLKGWQSGGNAGFAKKLVLAVAILGVILLIAGLGIAFV
jgi:hypothetical protein